MFIGNLNRRKKWRKLRHELYFSTLVKIREELALFIFHLLRLFLSKYPTAKLDGDNKDVDEESNDAEVEDDDVEHEIFVPGQPKNDIFSA
jgi:hypothetical protein